MAKRLAHSDALGILGNSCYWSWVLLDRSGTISHGSSYLPYGQFILTGSMAIAGLVFFIFSGIAKHRTFRLVLSTAITAFILLGLICSWLSNGLLELSMASAVFFSIARGGFMQIWAFWVVSIGAQRATYATLSSMVMSAVIFLVMTSLPHGCSVVGLPLLAAFSAVLSFAVKIEDSAGGGSADKHETSGMPGFLVRQGLIGFVIGLLGIVGVLTGILLTAYQRILLVVSACALFALLTYLKKKRTVPNKSIIALPVALAIFFVLPFGLDASVVAKIAFLLCWLYSAPVSILHIVKYSHRSPYPLERTALLGQAACAVGTFFGSCIMSFAKVFDLSLLEPHLPGVSMACAFGFMACAIIFLQGFLQQPEERTINEASDFDQPLPVYDEDSSYEKACARLAERSGLTPRESEILRLLGKGYSRRHVGEELYLSESTVKSHANSIYRKLDIHKHDELLEMISREKTGI